MSQFADSFTAFQEQYYMKQTASYEPESEDVNAVQIPQTDFDPYYSDIPNYESELDSNYLSIHDLNLPEGAPLNTSYPSHITNMVPQSDILPAATRLNRISSNLPSDPPITFSLPVMERAQCQFDDLPSSPPSSPPRPIPSQRTQQIQMLDPLGIGHPFMHRSQSSISSRPTELTGALPNVEPRSAASDRSMHSPFSTPPLPIQAVSPFMQRYHKPGALSDVENNRNAYSSSISLAAASRDAQQSNHDLQPPPSITRPPPMPDLSPTLSDASISPDPSSPDHGEFCWQPTVTISPSLQSENIIEQQRRPKFKRKSCLPDGVVEEYVGFTDTEGVFVCLYPGCKKLFKRTYNLRSHIQTHLCDRPYICNICGADFVRPHDLRRHERCHSTVKPFICPCGKAFNRQDAMQRHRLREICEGAISSGVPKSPKPRGRPKGRRNTPASSPELDESRFSCKTSALDSELDATLKPCYEAHH